MRLASHPAQHLRSFSMAAHHEAFLRLAPASTEHAPWTACAFAGSLCSRLATGEGPAPSVLILVSPAFLGADSSAPSDSSGGPWRVVGVSLAACPLVLTSLTKSPGFVLADAITMAEGARASWHRPRSGAPQARQRVHRCLSAPFCSTAPLFCLGLFSRAWRCRA